MLNQQSIFPRLSCYLMATTLALLTACSSMPDKSTSNQNQNLLVHRPITMALLRKRVADII